MNGLGRAVAMAFASLVNPRMLWLMIWPVLAAVLLWGGIVIWFWAELALWLGRTLHDLLFSHAFFARWDLADAAVFAAKLLILVSLVPLIQITALFILGAFGMGTIVAHVAAYHPQLARRAGGGFFGSLGNALVALAGLAVFFVVSLPLWFFPPLWPLVLIGIMAWVNQRVLRYDALAAHADAIEMRRLFRARRLALFALGAALALLAWVPFFGFFAQVPVGLAVAHLLLEDLARLRAAPLEAEFRRL